MVDWTKTEVALEFAKGIAFDDCHKIYVLMDDEQMAQMKEYGYEPLLLSSADYTPEQMIQIIKLWWDKSCGLRFVSAVKTTQPDPNDGFISLIGQGEYDDEDEDEEEDKTECFECSKVFESDGNETCEDCREAEEEDDED